VGSVCGPAECPKCKYEEAYEESVYSEGSRYLECPKCHYSYSKTRIVAPKGSDNYFLGDGSQDDHYEIEEGYPETSQFIKLMPVTDDPNPPTHTTLIEGGLPMPVIHCLQGPEALIEALKKSKNEETKSEETEE